MAHHPKLIDSPISTPRPYRELRKQPSLVRALYGLASRIKSKLRRVPGAKRDFVTAHFKSASGDIPVTFYYALPGRSQLSNKRMSRFDYFFKEYANFGKDRRVAVWLAYMPCKERVLHDRVEFSATAPEKIRNWHPCDLPDVILGMCRQYGIGFIDLSPVLIRETSLPRSCCITRFMTPISTPAAR